MSIKKKVIQSESIDMENLEPNIETKEKIEIIKHVLTGLSYMVPILVLFSIVRVFEQIFPIILLGAKNTEEVLDILKQSDNKTYALTIASISYLLSQFRVILFQSATPIFAAFIAHSIGGKIALILGFVGGCIANNPITSLVLVDGDIKVEELTPSGFLGAMIVALIIGYIVRYLNKAIKVERKFLSLKAHLIIPVIGLVSCILLMIFVINPIVGYVGIHVKSLIESTRNYNEYIYAILMSMATTFDLGGPINKTAGAVCLGLYMDGVYPVTARTLSVVIPSIGLGLSTIIDKRLVGRKVFDNRFYISGKNALWLGIMGISEGGLPFVLERPKFVIGINILGSIMGSLVAISLGACQTFPESAIWAWFFADNLFAYLTGVVSGSLFIALVNVFYRNRLIKLGKLKIN
ncbi:MAG: PTS fructose transporter subunit IIC [Romboutsia sp.]